MQALRTGDYSIGSMVRRVGRRVGNLYRNGESSRLADNEFGLRWQSEAATPLFV